MKVPEYHITTQHQHWPMLDRCVIAAISQKGSLLGTVQLELYKEKQKFGGTAYIFALWVEDAIRRNKIASNLLDHAEYLAKQLGHKSVALEWSVKEAPIEIHDWYGRRGYDDKELTPLKCALMIKKLQ